ncbi:MAG: glycosyltransferase family 4 protein [Bacteroidota bacterium]|nr:glycosyltransferase family 4 protein [Bacteroidota bacterium]
MDLQTYTPYLLGTFILLFSLLAYLQLAPKWGIIDNPNHRSSHTRPTVRGGGILIPIAVVLAYIFSGYQYPWMMVSILLVSVISFVDDIRELSPKLRLPFQMLAVILMLYSAGLPMTWWAIPVFILAMGMMNAYNFMDGINGITGLYSLVCLGFLGSEMYSLDILSPAWVLFPAIACILFLYANFRKRALCFLGDVGSISLALLVLFLLGKLILYTAQPLYALFLLVYGLDAGLTVIQRWRRGEDLMSAHRSHLYQYLTKPGPYSHRQVAVAFAILQMGINGITLVLIRQDPTISYVGASLMILFSIPVYLVVKKRFTPET